MTDYTTFLRQKIKMASFKGFDVKPEACHEILFPHQRDIVRWAVLGGNRAIFASFGLGKSVMQVEWLRQIVAAAGGLGLVVCPLGVRQDLIRDAAMLGIRLVFIRSAAEIVEGEAFYITNYETVRDGKLSPSLFRAVSLDEADVLRSFGSKTYQEFLPLFEGVEFKLVNSATPSPNRFKELIHYAGFLGVMDTGQALTRFFQRDSEKAGNLTLYAHKTHEFWLWVSSWAVFVQHPSDLCNCQCHNEPISLGSASGASRLKSGYREPCEMAPGGAPASAAESTSHEAATCVAASSSVAAASDQSMAGREPPPMLPGNQCLAAARTLGTKTGTTTGAEASLCASAGESSPPSSLTSANPEAGTRSSGGTTPGTTNPATAGGQHAKSKRATRGETSSSNSAGADNASRPGLKSSASTTGSSTADTSSAGHPIACSPTSCSSCRCAEYSLPPLDIRYHEIPSDYSKAGHDAWGQGMLFNDPALGLSAAAAEKRDSMPGRVAKVAEILAESPADHFIVWHDLEAERHALQDAIPEAVSVWGSQDLDEREQRITDFGNGSFRVLSTKPVIAGAGCNFQRHCHREVFAGIGFKFRDFIQAIHRVQRFQQAHPVRIDIVYSEAEREVLRTLQAKWAQHEEMVKTMTEIIKAYGLNQLAMQETLARSIGVKRIEVKGDRFTVANNDCVEEAKLQGEGSVDLIVTSIPFANHYEYSPSYNDFGHTEDNGHFWEQMDFLTPELLRMLKPGRIYACHVKDRILFGNVTGAGAPTVSPFHCEAIMHGRKHGFDYMGMVTVVTDVVRENNQTYRLTYQEQRKDGTKMGVGSPEYIVLFRKPQTDRSKGFADERVVKTKDEYSLARWQVDAHAFWRSGGNRQITAEELAALGPEKLASLFTRYSLEQVYDYEFHVRIGEELQARGALPSTFMSLAPGSHHPDVWHDVTRMLTLNSEQSRRAVEKHVCLARDSLVLTRRGFVPIQDVTVGDETLTHKGRWRRVEVVANTGVRPVVALRAQGVATLTLTPEHEVWARKTDWVRERDGAERAEPAWTRADKSVGGYVNMKLPPIEDCHLSEPELWLLGRWLADGHVGTREDFHVSIGPAKLAEFERMAGEYIGTKREDTAVQIRLKGMSGELIAALQQCGRGAANKQVPAHLIGLPTAKARALLDGYLSGDGHLVPGRGTWMAVSVSRALLLGVALLAQRAHGAVASLRAGRPAGTTVIQGREVTTRQEWCLQFDAEGSRRKTPFVLDDGAWKKVRSVDPAGEAETWCLRVEEDASFTAEGCIVANCPLQFDIVDRLIERYSNPGELVYDPFCGLGTVPYRAILKGRRGGGSELNPGYFMDQVHYLLTAERQVSMPSLFDVLDEEAAAAA